MARLSTCVTAVLAGVGVAVHLPLYTTGLFARGAPGTRRQLHQQLYDEGLDDRSAQEDVP
jgi:hypothetical protein